MVSVRSAAVLTLLATTAACAAAPAPVPQNPSPMVETTRAHGRLSASDTARGRRFHLDDVVSTRVQVFIPENATADSPLLLHFHGAAFIAEQAAAVSDRSYVVAVLNPGAGSRAHERVFDEPGTFDRLVAAIAAASGRERFPAVVLSGFSAGYGAIRAILRDTAAIRVVEGVVLLDGLHTSYVPEGRVLYEGGSLDTTLLEPFLGFARRARDGRARMLITHSEIFPGTFASTTETSDYLIRSLGLTRTPVLEWGPLGMQQLSTAGTGAFRVLGFAGNTAPDHVDHLHALPEFLRRYDALVADRIP